MRGSHLWPACLPLVAACVTTVSDPGLETARIRDRWLGFVDEEDVSLDRMSAVLGPPTDVLQGGRILGWKAFLGSARGRPDRR